VKAAEAEVRRLDKEQEKLEVALAEAEERLERLEEEAVNGEERRGLSKELNKADDEVIRLRELLDEVEQAGGRAQEQVDWLSGDYDDDDEDDSGERLSVWDAADIWMSSGMDEDRRFGYTEEELRRAAEE
jgi:hypothetical protein